MSISAEVSRLETAKTRIKDHLVSLGIADGTETIDELAAMVETLGVGSGSGSDLEINSITLELPNADYVVGDNLDLTDARVLAHYVKDVTAQSVFTPANGTALDTAGTINIAATYTESERELSDSIQILVAENLPYVVHGANNDILYFTDVNNLCSTGNATSSLTINGTNVIKSNIKEIHLRNKFTDLPNNFANLCQNVTVIDGLSEVKTIGVQFARASAGNLNCDLDLRNCEQIGDSFLVGQINFNGNILFSKSMKSIGTYFMQNCEKFNKPLTLPEELTVTKGIGNMFMSGCKAFDSVITLPKNLETIGTYFMQNNITFNKEITIPNTLKSIGNSFLSGCTMFNKPLTIPISVTSVGTGFMSAVVNMVEEITINNAATAFASDNWTLAGSSNTALSYTQGIRIGGTNKAAFKSRFPDRTASPYRKLILA